MTNKSKKCIRQIQIDEKTLFLKNFFKCVNFLNTSSVYLKSSNFFIEFIKDDQIEKLKKNIFNNLSIIGMSKLEE